MNKKFLIQLPGDQVVEVDGTGFYHAVDGLRFGFFLHKAHDSDQLCVSHQKSGALVALVSDERRRLAKDDLLLAAREAVDEYATRKGSETMKQALLRLEHTLRRSPV